MKIVGKNSGDYESFCLDVDFDTFVKVKGTEPDEFDGSYFNPGTYRLYMSDIISKILPEAKDNDLIEIEINIKKSDF